MNIRSKIYYIIFFSQLGITMCKMASCSSLATQTCYKIFA